jgi:hypothetical protein
MNSQGPGEGPEPTPYSSEQNPALQPTPPYPRVLLRLFWEIQASLG